MSSQNKKTYLQNILFDNLIVRDHQLYNVRTLPGVTLLDMIYRLSLDYIGTQEIELRNILYKQPIVVSEEFYVEAYVTFEPYHDYYRVKIESKRIFKDTNSNNKYIENMECYMYRVADDSNTYSKFNVQKFIDSYTKKWDMDDVYATARECGIFHYIFMKTLGTAYQINNEELFELHLSDLADNYRKQFYIHPAFLDGSTFSGTSFLLNDGSYSNSPYIPFMIKRFRAFKPFPNVIYTYSVDTRNNKNFQNSIDIIDRNINIYDSEGHILVEFEGLTIKRIREPKLIKKLLNIEKSKPSIHSEYIEPNNKNLVETKEKIKNNSEDEIVSYLKEQIGYLIDKDASSLSVDEGFYDLGLDSTQLLQMVNILEEKLGVPLYPTLLFEFSTIERLSKHLHKNYEEKFEVDTNGQDQYKVETYSESKFDNDSSEDTIVLYLKREIGKLIDRDYSSLSIEDGFYDLGLDSTQLLQMVTILEEKLEAQLYPTLLFEFSTIERLSNHLHENYEEKFKEEKLEVITINNLDNGNNRLLLMEPVYVKSKLENGSSNNLDAEHIIFFFSKTVSMKEVKKHFFHAEVYVLEAMKGNDAEDFEEIFIQVLKLIKDKLNNILRRDLVIQLVADTEKDRFVTSLKGLLRTASQENPKIYAQIVTIDQLNDRSKNEIISILSSEYQNYTQRYISANYKLDSLERHIETLREVPIHNSQNIIYKNSGIYVITGGLGGLGIAVAKHIMENVDATIILMGRSSQNDSISQKINLLNKGQSKIIYLKADVGNENELKEAISTILKDYGMITGIFHCAGVLNDEFLIAKNISNISKTFQPKVKGTYHLDLFTKDVDMDFFVLFSSISAIIGNPGQADYASANSFMDVFAASRNELVKLGRRSGKTISINWTLWKSDGMKIEQAFEERLYNSNGLVPMPTNVGIQMLDSILDTDRIQNIVFYGQQDKILQATKQYMINETQKIHNDNTGKNVFIEDKVIISNDPWDNTDDIAIVGLSGRYPEANTIENLYMNLKNGKDCITEFPIERWRNFKSKDELEKFYKYGAFVENADKFDSMFFNITPKQAERMDPQVRLFLQSAWETCEDAGFYQDRKKQNFNSSSDNCVGVFAGVFWNDYDLLAEDMTILGQDESLGINTASIPNMVSYVMNFHGPSISVDTMCSSSLTAIHLACESIRKNECNFAIAGGINIVTHPHKYLFLKNSQFLSSDARCRSFGEGGDGYVPGEGVGTVMLTSLKRAKEEGYHIYGVIKGSALNHAGKTSGTTVPDPVAQSEVIKNAIKNAGIDPRTISYIEAHGTGTSLGDPIEIKALQMAFSEWTNDKQFCAIGSIKSNIGHAEGAAGISGLTKILLQMKYKEIFPNLHSEIRNPYISFQDSPFYVAQELKNWEESFIDGKSIPRRAGLSSFGANGSNAHIIIEEYKNNNDKDINQTAQENGYVILLSAKNKERLHLYAMKLLNFILDNRKTEEPILRDLLVDDVANLLSNNTGVEAKELIELNDFSDSTIDFYSLNSLSQQLTNKYSFDFNNKLVTESSSIIDIAEKMIKNYKMDLSKHYHVTNNQYGGVDTSLNLRNLAYTLQVGREPMDERLAFVVNSYEELIYNLDSYLNDNVESNKKYYSSNVQHNNLNYKKEIDEEYYRTSELCGGNLERNQLEKLAEFWVTGMKIDWERISRKKNVKRLSLPTYPFEEKRYWITDDFDKSNQNIRHDLKLYAMIHENNSTLLEQKYSTTFTGEEYFLRDHRVNGEKVLPGTGYLEMVLEAIKDSLAGLRNEPCTIVIKNVIWSQPMMVNNSSKTVKTCIYPEDNGDIGFEIYSEIDDCPIIHSQGSVELRREFSQPKVELNELIKKDNKRRISSDTCYEYFLNLGIEYGPAHQAIKEILVKEDFIISSIQLPDCLKTNFDEYILHPCILDSAFQSTIGALDQMGIHNMVLPFSLDELIVYDKCRNNEWAIVKTIVENDNFKFNIELLNEDGEMTAAINGLSVRPFERVTSNEINVRLMLEPIWKQNNVAIDKEYVNYEEHLVIFFEQEDTYIKIIEEYLRKEGSTKVLNLKSDEQNIGDTFAFYGTTIFHRIKEYLKEKQKRKILIQVICMDDRKNELYRGISGLLKSATLENPELVTQRIEILDTNIAVSNLVGKILESKSVDVSELRYENENRYVLSMQEIENSNDKNSFTWKENGVYIITGGMGYLGWIFAENIYKNTEKVSLILTGRSELSEEMQSKLKQFTTKEGTVEYKKVNINSRQETEDFIQYTIKKYGKINGIIHSAGIIKDNFIIKKSEEEFNQVLEPKIKGVFNLDEATKKEEIDFLLLFSSISAVRGNEGQSDYSYANAFMDGFASYRNKLVEDRKRTGRTISINWPLWKTASGMSVNEDVKRNFMESFGMVEMEEKEGIEALYDILSLKKEQVAVIEGNRKKILKAFTNSNSLIGNITTKNNKGVMDSTKEEMEEIRNELILYLKEVVSTVTKLEIDKIEVDHSFDNYGIDSVMILQFTQIMEKKFGSLPKTLFFEYLNIKELAEYFLQNHIEKLKEATDKQNQAGSTVQGVIKNQNIDDDNRNLRSRSHKRFAFLNNQDDESDKPLDIAIIGVSGKYPGANDLIEYWENLKNGIDNITEIPKERWDYNKYYEEDKTKIGKVSSKWGGFIDGIADFDPLFFNISPYEAELMDPQERLFLECVYETLEDAGYTRESLNNQKGSEEVNIGVFAGIMYEEYQLYGVMEQMRGRDIALAGVSSSIANRISYFFNFHGPSIAINTMCSSSLTAIHLACQSIKKKECNVAIAGGVNISIHPNKYITLGQGNFLSSNGKCESFGNGGDGYVPGEGVGSILLKPLSKAIEDGDNIYGVIKGSAINHGGKTNGYTVPNVKAQENVISKALKESGITPRQISYIEAHGTGTILGDPIEIQGITNAFSEGTNDRQFCAIGSVKSNIGHCESAAGMAGLTKILLQMKYKQIVPSLHSKQLNKNIDFEKTPFIVQQELGDWKQPVINNKIQLRYAGLSSFGAGGSNSHLIIQEYISAEKEEMRMEKEAYAVILSARTQEQLNIKAEQLLAYLRRSKSSSIKLEDIVYTLQVGREEMDERLGLIIKTKEELEEKLEKFIAGEHTIRDMYIGHVKSDRTSVKMFLEEDDLKVTLDKWVENKKYKEMLKLWVKGVKFDWSRIYRENKPKRISLPTYPFEKVHCWISSRPELGNIIINTTSKILPLLDKNISTLSEQKYCTNFSGDEYLLRDHKVNGEKVLPGTAYIEMALEAALDAVKDTSIGSLNDNYKIIIKNIMWSRPMIVAKESKIINTSIFPEENGIIGFEIYGGDDTNPIIYSQGNLELHSDLIQPKIDMRELMEEENKKVITSENCYNLFSKLGIEYGPAHQAIKEIIVKKDLIISRIQLPDCIKTNFPDYILHPSLLDSAIQSIIGSLDQMDIHNTVLPFSIDELIVYDKCRKNEWAIVKTIIENDNLKFNIELINDEGEMTAAINGLSVREIRGTDCYKAPIERLMLEPVWKQNNVAFGKDYDNYEEHLVIFFDQEDTYIKIIEEYLRKEGSTKVLNLKSDEQNIGDTFAFYGTTIFHRIKEYLKEKQKRKILIQVICMDDRKNELYRGISGLLKSATLENPELVTQRIEILDTNIAESELVKKILESKSVDVSELRYENENRYVLSMQEIENSNDKNSFTWKENGVYIITGGMGYLGWIFAENIYKNTEKVSLILTGRSELSEEMQSKLKQLTTKEGTVEYNKVNINSRQETEDFIQYTLGKYGKINGIIHSAGIIKDNFIIKKSEEEFNQVLEPKIKGVFNLDEATKKEEIDFLLLFSSISAVRGNEGQSDYSYANAFMDGFASYRNKLVEDRKRTGRTISINWPLWKTASGMDVNEEVKRNFMESFGMVEMEEKEGIEALYDILSIKKEQVAVINGDRSKLLKAFTDKYNLMEGRMTSGNNNDVKESISEAEAKSINNNLVQYLKEVVSSVTKLEVDKIEVEHSFDNYGIDSVMILQLTQILEKKFGPLPKTLFFEYLSIGELSEYFLQNHMEKLKESPVEKKQDIRTDQAVIKNHESLRKDTNLRSRRQNRFALFNNIEDRREQPLDIAIIGMAGMYPGASNVEKYWENLKNGIDSITEIPSERWDYSKYYDQDKTKIGKVNSKWGGFIDGVADFDPLFFNISPYEAEIMDPQERLFLECVYKTLEDGGYTRETLSGQQCSDMERNVGVFAGIMNEEYQLYGVREQLSGRDISLAGVSASIANRISYYFNFHGPSIAINTMCSSSLTAIHLACQSIGKKECDVAIAGGVNVSIHPNKYIALNQNNFLSSEGRCRSFGNGGDGYVPGEGVGAVLLKPLSKAIEDGDNIYGIIKGSAINHGGKTNGYTVPNVRAQENVISKALKESGINPRQISYIEAHGTGTSLGDPIEIQSLTKAFSVGTSDRQFCAIGSAKSNIGHCESAAGIAGLAKILLQMKHNQLVPSLHSKELNENIDFVNTPFIVQQELSNWEIPIINNKKQYRNAGLSSFGAGGSNAHLIIQEYVPEERVEKVSKNAEYAVVLSARTHQQLIKKSEELLLYIRNIEKKTNFNLLEDMVYTLQLGREEMDVRLGLIVKSYEELEDKLEKFINDENNIQGMFVGNVKTDRASVKMFLEDEDLKLTIDKWVKNNKYKEILNLWVKGIKIDWNQLYSNKKPVRISLPTYPFEKVRCWIPVTTELGNFESGISKIHPIIHENMSTLLEQKYCTTFTGNEYFFNDYKVNGEKVLPDVIYLEMALAATNHSFDGIMEDNCMIKLCNVMWLQPMILKETAKKIYTKIYQTDNGEIGFEIYEGNKKKKEEISIYTKGNIELCKQTRELYVDVNEIMERCNLESITSKDYYDMLSAMNIVYGSTCQGINKIFVGHEEVLSEIILPDSVKHTMEEYTLQPNILDSAIRAQFGLMINETNMKPNRLFTINEIDIIDNCEEKMFSWIRFSNKESQDARDDNDSYELDIDLFNAEGKTSVKMKGVISGINQFY